MTTYYAQGSPSTVLSDEDLRAALFSVLEKLGPRERVLALPPDFTRFHSQAGKITRLICEHYNFVPGPQGKDEPPPKKTKSTVPKIEILPALGTHAPMTNQEIEIMFGPELAKTDCFLVHDWRNDVETIGHAPAEMVRQATGGQVDKPWPAQLNKLIWSKREQPPEQAHRSLVLSIGQVVPHEVMGMAK